MDQSKYIITLEKLGNIYFTNKQKLDIILSDFKKYIKQDNIQQLMFKLPITIKSKKFMFCKIIFFVLL